MSRILNRKNLIRAGLLVLAAMILAVGLEWVMLRTLPPVFTDAEVQIPQDPTLLERGETYVHASGRIALREEWYAPRLLVIFLMQLIILTLVFPTGLWRKAIAGLKRCASGLKRSWIENGKQNLISAGIFVLVAAVVYFLAKAWIWDAYQRDNWITHTVCLVAGGCAGFLAAFRGTTAKKPEIVFLVLVMAYGGIMAWFMPDSTRVALDDGFHFQHALNYSTLGHVRYTRAEWDEMGSGEEPSHRENHLEKREAFLAAQDEKYSQGAIYVTTGFHMDPKEYWMATQGLGLFLGRVLGLRFWDMWSLGRFTGLFAYALIGYFAIRRLKSGKMIFALALMTPSCVFLAANYSYDPGVIAGIAISFSYWIAQWQERDRKLRNVDIAVMLGGMLIACYAKAIYFPIMLLFLFLPKSKFRDRQHRRNYTLLVLFSIVAVMLYILLPLSASGGQGDDRASGDVDTFRQIQFILTHPGEYALILWHLVEEYIDPNNMWGALSSFGYMGAGTSMSLIMMILAVAAFTDQSEEGLLPPFGIRLLGEAVLFGTLLLMSTAMYVWFSEVGSESFDGMQERYLIPFIYPAMSMMGSNRAKNHVHPALYNGVLFALMLFAAFSGVINNCIEIYR